MNRNRIFIGCLIGALTAVAAADDLGATSIQKLSKKFWNRDAASHLLRRAGFGGTPEQVQRLVNMGLEGAVNSLVDYDRIEWTIAPPPTDPLLLAPAPTRKEMSELSEDQRREVQNQRRRAQRRTFEETRLWWIDRMVRSPRPFEEKMTLFWHGHFTSGMREVRNPFFMREQNELLRDNALGNFRDLLKGICRDRAMLVYLDNARNVKRKPNENFARELMELFSLGEGNYSEADIKAAARAFTGWAYDGDGFQFREKQHDYGRKKFLGKTGRWNGLDIVKMIMAQPACSQFLARNLLEYFCQPDPSRQLVNRVAGLIRKHKFELKPVMKTMFMSKMFYHDDSRGSLIKSPVELLVGTARQLGVPLTSLPQAERAMAAMGQEVMQPPNVKGWDGDEKWINTATLFNRYNFVGGLINGLARRGGPRRGAIRTEGDTKSAGGKSESKMMMQMTMGSKSRLKSNPQPPYDPMPAIAKHKLDSSASIVDHFARHLLAVPLSSEKRAHLVSFLDGDDSGRRGRTRRKADRVRTMIHLMASTPEFQMN